MNKSMTLIGTTVIALAVGQGVLGDNVYVWDAGGDGQSWSDGNNWDENAVPNSVDHKVVIDPGSADTVLMNGNYTVGELIVGQLATLNIQGTKTLTLDRGTSSPTQNGRLTIEATASDVFGVINIRDNGTFTLVNNDNTSPYHQIGGNIVLNGSGSIMQITTDSATFNPYFDGSSNWYGNVIGEHSSATFSIAGDLTLTFEVDLEGMLQMTDGGGGSSDPLFFLGSNGAVDANAVGTLSFQSGLNIDDEDLAQWIVANNSGAAKLQFNYSPSSTLDGDFFIDHDDELEINVAGVVIQTTGTLTDLFSSTWDGVVDVETPGGASDNTKFIFLFGQGGQTTYEDDEYCDGSPC